MALVKALTRTVHHFFRGWLAIFGGVSDGRHPGMVLYPLEALLCTGVLMFLFHLGARRQINFKLRGNGPAQAKFGAWFGVEQVPHGDTVNYGFLSVDVAEVQEVVCRMVEILIRKKVLYRWRLFANYLVVMDGTGVLTFRQRHCPYCLTQKLSSGEILYYHPVLEAKLVTANGFAISLMTEFIENRDLLADKQDCELRAFYRLTKRLKQRFPRLPICLLLDGLYAGGPTFQLCDDYDWQYLIVLREDDLPNVHRSFALICSQEPGDRKRVLRGQQQEIVQQYRWATGIEYMDHQDRQHVVNVIACEETTPTRQGETSTTTFKWLTNFMPTWRNVDTLANQGARLRWKIENEGFNIQKNGGFNLQHPYSHHENAQKVFYLLLQIAHLIYQLIAKGSPFRQAFPEGVGSQKNIAFRLLEAWRNLDISAAGFSSLYKGRYQIRLDTS